MYHKGTFCDIPDKGDSHKVLELVYVKYHNHTIYHKGKYHIS